MTKARSVRIRVPIVQSKSLIDAAKRNDVNHIVHLGAFTRDHDA
jgi:hypothetical protein